MSDDPHPCMKVTSHIRNLIKMSATAVHIQEQNVSLIFSDDNNSSNLILNAENIAAKNLNHNQKLSFDDLRPYLLAPKNSVQHLRLVINKYGVCTRRFSNN
ncbi:MAG: hypothetical protein IJS88_03740 [Alphaproteobacteria bacterium]|nr:hypothetical protein [Alphaproteobacteria bacterium]